MARPALVAHADWSWRPPGRALVVGRLHEEGHYLLERMAPGEPADLLARLAALANGPAVVGFDLPIGLPRVYARTRGIKRFDAFLAGLAPDDPFFRPADEAELELARPFYPRRPGGASRARQAAKLGVADHRQLWRLCDHPTDRRSGACCMFWTLGPQQCGKAALACWQDVLRPAAVRGVDVALWPFAGGLAELVATRTVTVVETYPAECYGQLGLPRFAKTRLADRRAQAPLLRALTADLGAVMAPDLAELVATGFADPAAADHLFDALVGCLALMAVLAGRRAEGVPAEPTIRSVEGWMLGLDAKRLRLPQPPGPEHPAGREAQPRLM